MEESFIREFFEHACTLAFYLSSSGESLSCRTLAFYLSSFGESLSCLPVSGGSVPAVNHAVPSAEGCIQ